MFRIPALHRRRIAPVVLAAFVAASPRDSNSAPVPIDPPCALPVFSSTDFWPPDGAVDMTRVRKPSQTLTSSGTGGAQLQLYISPDGCVSAGTLPNANFELEPDTTYWWKVRATNECGFIDSPCRSFHTTACRIDPIASIGTTLVAVRLSGRHAFATNGPDGLSVFDLDDPTVRRARALLPLPLGAGALERVGTKLFVGGSAPASTGIQVVDIADPLAPSLDSILPYPGPVAAGGNLLLVVDPTAAPNNVRLLDVSNPARPSARGSLPVDGTVHLSGDLLFDSSTDRLRIWDISDPDAPVLRSETSPWNGETVVAMPGWMFADGRSAGELFTVWNIADPSRPSLASVMTLEREWGGVMAAPGNRLFVGSRFGNPSSLWDVTNPLAPVVLGQVAAACGVPGGRLLLEGDRGVCTSGWGFTLVDFSNPAQPRSDPREESFGEVLDARILGNALLATSRERGLLAYDIAVPEAPRLTVRFETPPDEVAWGLSVDGDLLALLSSGRRENPTTTARFFDIADPSAPLLRGTLTNLSDSVAPILDDGRFFAIDAGNQLRAWDLSNPTSPALLGSLAVAEPRGMRRISVSDGLAIVPSGDGLSVADFRNPAAPTILSSPSFPGTSLLGPVAALPSRRWVFAGQDDGCMFFCNIVPPWDVVVDLSSPASPILLGPAGTGFGSPATFRTWWLSHIQDAGGASTFGNVLFEGANFLRVSDFSNGLPKGPKAEIRYGHDAAGFYVDPTGHRAVSPSVCGFEIFDVSLCAGEIPKVAVPRVEPIGPFAICRSGAIAPPITLRASVPFASPGACDGLWLFQWDRNGIAIAGATDVEYRTPSTLPDGLQHYVVRATCSTDPSVGGRSNGVQVAVSNTTPESVSDLFAAKTRDGYDFQATWSDLPGAADYLFVTDSTPDGPFSRLLGAAISGEAGVRSSARSGSGDLYFQVRASNGCGTGP